MDIKYRELRDIYNEYFGLSNINSDINTKFALISLICYLTNAYKKKKPDVNHYQIVMKLSEGLGLPDNFIKGLSIMCENFAYGCTEFPTFNIPVKEMAKTVRDILKKWMPF